MTLSGVPAAAALGALIEIGVMRRLYARDHLDQVLATFALILIFSEGARMIFGAQPLWLDIPKSLSGHVSLPGGAAYPVYRLAIIGAGFIGRAWAVAFARAGMNVAIWSRREATAQKAIAFLAQVLPGLEEEGLLGDLSPQEILSNARIETRLGAALEWADYFQENAPEDLQSKKDVFSLLDSLADKNAIIASSTSALLPSAFTAHLAGRDRCLVVHPINPPYLVPAAELVPARNPPAAATASAINARSGSR